MDGMTRVCTFADGHTQNEAILDYSPAARSYRYTIDGGLPVADNRGRFVVEPAGNGARVVWESSFVALDPAAEAEVSRLWAGMLPVVLGLPPDRYRAALTSAWRSWRAGGAQRAARSSGRPNAWNSEASWKPVMAWIPSSATTSTMRP